MIQTRMQRLMLCALALAAGLQTHMAHAAQTAQAGTDTRIMVRDDRQKTVVLERSPQRVVSLLPSLTESVCALGACGRLVGVDDYSNWPDAVERLPRLGGLESTPIEQVLALKPDVVFAATGSRAATRLEALGIKVVALEPRSLDDVARVLEQVARVLGLPAEQANVLWRRMDASVDASAQELADANQTGRREKPRERVYFEVGSGPYAAGPTSFIGGLLTRLGADNVVGAKLGAYPRLNPEYVVRAAPQRIMIGARNAQELDTRPGWQAIPAMAGGKVCVFSDAQMDMLVRPGPRLGDAAEILADCLLGRMDRKPDSGAQR